MEKKREKDDRKRQEQERREQREKEKKEQDIRKRFKVVGAIEVFQMVKASVDYKGGKNDLSFKQGENLEVIRITDNPEGRWLARTMDGCYGYIKVTCVDIDYDDVRKKAIGQPKDTRPQPEADPELYDDVAPVDDITT
uniref:FYN-binding protein-like n=2 Tax=Callorhinchus milii TaxID=7868 RepID=A0A4W3GKC7_CALMI